MGEVYRSRDVKLKPDVPIKFCRTASRFRVLSDLPGGRVKHYPNFDLFRLLLASSVLLLHWFAFQQRPINFWLLPWDAVPCFVAISGFLIAGSFEKNPDVGHFIWKRACRLVPALILSMTLVGVLYGMAAIPPTLVVYFTAGWLDAPGQRNGVLWSLMVEEVLYASLIVMVLTGWLKRRWPIYVLLTLTVLGFQSTADMLGNYERCAIAFLVGVIFYLNRESLAKVKPYFWAGFLILGYLIRERFPVPYFHGNISSAFQAAALLGFAAYGPRLWSQKLPDISYGMYLYHIPILGALLPHFKNRELFFGLFGMTFLMSLMSAYFVERPFIRLKNLRFRKSETVMAAVSTVPDELSRTVVR
jgi:peptidoglycan/LPS O-acetylase OafA/YrhL